MVLASGDTQVKPVDDPRGKRRELVEVGHGLPGPFVVPVGQVRQGCNLHLLEQVARDSLSLVGLQVQARHPARGASLQRFLEEAREAHVRVFARRFAQGDRRSQGLTHPSEPVAACASGLLVEGLPFGDRLAIRSLLGRGPGRGQEMNERLDIPCGLLLGPSGEEVRHRRPRLDALGVGQKSSEVVRLHPGSDLIENRSLLLADRGQERVGADVARGAIQLSDQETPSRHFVPTVGD